MRKGLQEVRRILVLCVLALLALGGILFARPPQETFASRFARQRQVRPVREVTVVDSRGKVVGATLGGLGLNLADEGGISDIGTPENKVNPIILLHVEGQLLAVNVARDRFYAANFLYFDSEDCTGSPWVHFDAGSRLPLLPRIAIALPGQTVYVEVDGAGPQPIPIQSRMRDGRDCENVTFPIQNQYVRMQPLVDLSTVFPPPFSLRAVP